MSAGSPKRVTAFAPATVANLGFGFDVLGLALAGLGDKVSARLRPEPGVLIETIRGDDGALPTEAERNTAGIAARAVLERAGLEVGIALELDKGLPLGSGLGSSAASAAAAAFAVNRLLGSPLRKPDLIGPCLDAEEAVSGRHADNAAPAILGGLTLVRSLSPIDVIRLPVPEDLWVAVVTPAFELPTAQARAALPKQVPLTGLVRTSANLSAFISACHSGDLALMARCLPEQIVTPVRAGLIPGSDAAMEAALDLGAIFSSISGAGPSIFSMNRSRRSAEETGRAMVSAFASVDLPAGLLLSPADSPGVRIL